MQKSRAYLHSEKENGFMKKVLSVVLALVMLVSVLSVAAAAASGADLKIAVASDLHFNEPREQIDGEIDDPIYWYANRRAAMEDESGFIIDEFLNQCAEDDSIEYVLISGDMADNGKTRPEDHRTVAAKLEKFEQETGKDVFVIDGNHDVGEGENITTLELFKEIYANLGYDKALTVAENDCSYTADLGAKYRLIALDSCDPSVSTEDGMTNDKIEWVHTQAEAALEEGRHPILMMHHNLLDHLPLQRILSHDFIVRNHLATAELFADWGIKVVLTGHEHCSDATSYTSGLGNTIYDFATTSLTMYPLQFRTFEFTDEEITYDVKTVDKIDTDALQAACGGYSQEQIDLMNAGLNDYALGFLKKGVEYRLALGLTMEKIGVEEDSIFYDLVKTAVDGLTNVLEMPLYGEDGVQELAKEYELEIPDTEFTTGWDLATGLVAWHYAGEEAFELDSPEVLALLRTAAYILRTDLPAIGDSVFFQASNFILESLGMQSVNTYLAKICVGTFGSVMPLEYFVVTVASPLLFKFAYDDDGVNDNYGVIEGYGAQELGVMSNDVEGFFGELLLKLQYIVHYLLRIFDFLK